MANVIIEEDKCKGCGLCAAACPKKIITLGAGKLNARGFHPAVVTDMTQCLGCAFCAVMCPDVVITVFKE
ncbi:MAG: 4Fe-4S binding protein [Clostridiales bacterium]|jgi:2-oxoglutarate ferredoxin oxidoreductase subunit delta|nr:4Fe-4S binding protein [Clostridiales bacterium]